MMKKEPISCGITGIVLIIILGVLDQTFRNIDILRSTATHLPLWLTLIVILLLVGFSSLIYSNFSSTRIIKQIGTLSLSLGFVCIIIIALLLGNASTTLRLIVTASVGLLTSALALVRH